MESNYISQRITELRMKKGVAEHKMSIELGHSRSYLSSISTGRALPSMTEFLAICDYLEVSPKDFFDDGVSNPVLIDEIVNKSKNLSDNDLLLLLSIVNRLQP